MEFQVLDGFDVRPIGMMTQPGDTFDLEPVGKLRGHDRACAKGIAAVQRQRVVENVENPQHRGNIATTTLTARQPAPAKTRAKLAGLRA